MNHQKLFLSSLMMFGAISVAALFGISSSFGSPLIPLIFIVLTGSIILVTVKTHVFLLLIIYATFIAQGSIFYFFHLSQAQWLPYFLCVVASVRVLISMFNKSNSKSGNGIYAFTIICIFLYIAILIVSSIINKSAIGPMMAGLKNGLPFWIVTATILTGSMQLNKINLIWKALIFIFYIQVPMVLFQHFYIIPHRGGSAGWDGVVGSFGGEMDGGGASGTLIHFTLFIMAYKYKLFANKIITRSNFITAIMCGLITILAGEVKAVFVWLPFIGLYVLRKQIKSNPFQGILTIGATFLIVTITFIAYSVMYWSTEGEGKTFSEQIEAMTYFTDTSVKNYRTGEVSRGASIALWTGDSRTDITHRIIGYGAGASRISATTGMGRVAKRFAPLSITATAAANLLWDTGILGFLAYFGIIAGGQIMAMKLASHPAIGLEEQARIEALGVVLLICLTLFIYNRALIDEPSTQLMLAFSIGYLGYIWNNKSTYLTTLQRT